MKEKGGRMCKYEIFMAGSLPVIFLGVAGERGLIVYRKDSGWEYIAAGSLLWDSLHQETYRTHRSDRLTRSGLKARGVPFPSIGHFEKQVNFLNWEDNFKSAMPISKVPSPVLEIVQKGGGKPVKVYLVLFEDYYETCFGDGEFRYPHSAFPTKAEARDARIRQIKGEKNPSRREWFKYYLKEMSLGVDTAKKRLVAKLNLKDFEQYSINDVVRLLNKSLKRTQITPGTGSP